MVVFARLSRIAVVAALSALSFVSICTQVAFAQATTGTIAGTVKDAQGGVVPGATVTLVSETRGTTVTAVTSTTGDFVIPNIPGDRYTVRVSLSGFKTTERQNVSVTPGDRVSVGSLVLEQGTLSETVTVSTEAAIIQAQTGERSFVVATESVQNLPIAGRNFASFARLTPGVVAAGAGAARADGARTNYLLDGVSSVDTGGNQQGLQVNPDARQIARVRVTIDFIVAELMRPMKLSTVPLSARTA